MFKTSSTNQRDIKLVTNKFTITEGIIRQAANVSTVVILIIREGSANTFTSTSEMELLPTIVIMVFNVYLVAKSSICSRVPGLTLYKFGLHKPLGSSLQIKLEKETMPPNKVGKSVSYNE